MAELLAARSGAILTLTMNRPDRLNAVTEGLYRELVAALAEAGADAAIRAIVLTGAGRAFCVGADLKSHGGEDQAGTDSMSRDEKRRYAQWGQDAALAIMRCTKPVVAAVNGHAIGAGLELMLCCDLAVALDDAKLRLPELGLGTFVGGGTTFTLVERVGITRARELVLLGRFFSGADAARWGLCNASMATAEEVRKLSAEWADEVASKAPRSVSYAKRLLREAREHTIDGAMKAEAEALADCIGTKDWHEGIDAFRERRTPRFTGE
ncbi:MAG: enoyl-CoA hydratase/isomerase family protein [Planctomycetota bacterium]